MLIGVTGTIGSGKSAVAAELGRLLEAPVINADQLCRELMEQGQPGYEKFVAEADGRRFLDRSGAIDRVALRQALFSEPELKSVLEGILHPLVRAAVQQARAAASCHGSFAVAEVPLLFESGWTDDFDRIICVDAGDQTAILRVMARDRVDRREVEAIVASQFGSATKKERADVVIDNSGGWQETIGQVAELAVALKRDLSRGGNVE